MAHRALSAEAKTAANYIRFFRLWLSPRSGGGPARYRPPKDVRTRHSHPLAFTATAGGSLAVHSPPVP